LGGAGPGQNFAGTVAGSFIQMTAPKWFCSVICSGLDIDEVLNDSRVVASAPKPNTHNANFEPIISTNQEEQDAINVNQNQINGVAYTQS